MNWLLVALGGMLGSLCRYGLSSWVTQLFSKPLLPYGTMAVNILGCFMIGVIASLAQAKHGLRQEILVFSMIGFMGGFTTFSSFGLETFELIKQHHVFFALWDVFIQVGAGCLGVALGFWLVTLFV